MSSLPFPVRVAAGLVVSAVEEARDLPRTVVGLPITAVSQVLQIGMRAQQMVTELAIKGDMALDGMRPVEEAPSWARFDDDVPSLGHNSYDRDAWDDVASDGYDADTSLEFSSLGTVPAPTRDRNNGHASGPALGLGGETGDTPGTTPEALPGYETLTIAQLRGRLRSLSLAQVTELLAWESAHADRPPFVTMLSNRITTLAAEQ